jgi:hypothetical protein
VRARGLPRRRRPGKRTVAGQPVRPGLRAGQDPIGLRVRLRKRGGTAERPGPWCPRLPDPRPASAVRVHEHARHGVGHRVERGPQQRAVAERVAEVLLGEAELQHDAPGVVVLVPEDGAAGHRGLDDPVVPRACPAGGRETRDGSVAVEDLDGEPAHSADDATPATGRPEGAASELRARLAAATPVIAGAPAAVDGTIAVAVRAFDPSPSQPVSESTGEPVQRMTVDRALDSFLRDQAFELLESAGFLRRGRDFAQTGPGGKVAVVGFYPDDIGVEGEVGFIVQYGLVSPSHLARRQSKGRPTPTWPSPSDALLMVQAMSPDPLQHDGSPSSRPARWVFDARTDAEALGGHLRATLSNEVIPTLRSWYDAETLADAILQRPEGTFIMMSPVGRAVAVALLDDGPSERLTHALKELPEQDPVRTWIEGRLR